MSTAAAIAVLRAAYPGKFPEESIRVYTRMLADIPDDLLLAAVERLIKTSAGEWLPPVAMIRRAVAADILRLPDPDEAYEWAVSDRPLRGTAPQVLIDAVNAQGGRWNMQRADNPTIVKSQFLTDYKIAVERTITATAASTGCLPTAPKPLPPGGLQLGTTMRGLPVTARARPRPLLQWLESRKPPTDREKHDAILALRDLPTDDPISRVAFGMLDAEGK